MNEYLKRMILPKDLLNVLEKEMQIFIAKTRSDLLEKALGENESGLHEVAYEVPGKGKIIEATVASGKNGAIVNYTEPYMRRRDPDCMVIADKGISDKERYPDKFGKEFDDLRNETFDWLSQQDLIIMPFMAGAGTLAYPALLVAPDNAGFFAGGLADLQGFIPAEDIPQGFSPKAIIYLAPTFRHTHFEGRQMVVHNRLDNMYELFSYNLYPGPSAKKGVYGVLLKIGEEEGWITAHGSTVKIVTPYDNSLTIMHEGASGGGKSEMLEEIHREWDGKVLICESTLTGEKFSIELPETCELHPVTDDMALCHTDLQNSSKKLVVSDAEDGWFLRTNHIKKYGTDPYLESLCISPPEPLIFLNFDTVPHATCLLWEHIMDAPGVACPNPRVIMPRRFMPNTVDGPVEIDIRSFGVRTPPSTKNAPSYGILGMLHILPPALAWLWRLVAPRGHDNPSITDSGAMSSEGVGSYWPFATGRQVDQANMLLEQIVSTPNTRYILVPNQHIGAYKVGFMPQWLAREYLARRGGAKFTLDQLEESECCLLGYAPKSIKVEGKLMPSYLLDVSKQEEVGCEGFMAGAGILMDFFKRELEKFNVEGLDPLGRKIIDCLFTDCSVRRLADFIPMKL